jgi:ABA4-like protein
MDLLFSIGNYLVLPFWVLMILLPRWRWTERILRSPLVAAPPALLYAALVLPQLASLLPAIASPQLAEIAALLDTPGGATIAWLHFLAFDLLIGRWAYLDGRERGVSAWLMAPILFLILMFGPLGFLAYLAARTTWARLPRAGARRSVAA